MKVTSDLQISIFVPCILLVSGGSLIIRPEETDPFMPICTSYSGVCNIAYNVSEARQQLWESNAQICRCPGFQRCPTRWNETANSLFKVFKNNGKELEVKVSYCQLNQPSQICGFNRPAVILRGNGPFHFEVFGDFRCRCRSNRRLYAHRSWKLGDYNYIEYSCGKPRCIMNRTDNTCLKMTHQPAENNTMTEYFCRCRWNEECVPRSEPTAANPMITQTCQRV